MKKRVFEERLFRHYKRSESGGYILEINVPDPEEFFDRHDPSPVNVKDLNPRIMSLILEQIVVFPKEVNVELHFIFPKKSKKKVNETDLKNAVLHHFEYEYLDSELHLQRRLQKGLNTFKYSGTIFMTLFLGAYFLNQAENILLHLVSEGMWVGAWVSLWHPIETVLYDWLPLYEDKKKYERLMNTEIKFKFA